ncbi:MAG TPA: histidinol-phosphate transaminase [Casimicrobiaceae bacterium]
MNDRARGIAAGYVASVVRPDVRAQTAYVVADAGGMVKLDANESAHALPDAVRARVAAALDQVPLNRYPDGPASTVATALRLMPGLSAGSALLLGNGSDELITLIISLVAQPGATVLAPEPTFVMYRVSSAHQRVRFCGVGLNPDFTLDRSAMQNAVARERPAVVFIASPNNPTGIRYPIADIEAIIRAAPGLVVVDEAYSAFADDALLPRVAEFPNLLVMGTLSKIGMAGLRLGYVTGAPEWIAELDKLRPPYNINALTQAAVPALLADRGWIDEQGAAIRAERERLGAAMSRLPGIAVFPSEANFVLIRINGAQRIFEGLKRRGILVKNLSGAHALLADCLRITVGTPSENELLISSLSELCP